jgi:hypothetical protein
MTAKRKQLSEEQAFEIALADHPEWREDWENDTLPEEIEGEDGEPMNPRMHLMIHVIVERQLAADEPAGIVEVGRRLAEHGVSRHDIRHEIGRAFIEQFWQMQQYGAAFDEDQYMDDLEDIIRSHQ